MYSDYQITSNNPRFLKEIEGDNFIEEKDLDSHKVKVIIAHFDGNQFIKQQIDSIFAQSYKNFDLNVIDDNSDKNQLDYLLALRENFKKKINIKANPKNFGATYSFLYGLLDHDSKYSFYSWSDQDDVWFSEKLSRAINLISKLDQNVPVLYCSRTNLFFEQKRDTKKFSPLFLKPPSFSNALMQNIGGGNTMVMNRAARNIILKAGYDIQVPAHDWWAYILITAVGGTIIYDTWPSLLYRQHAKNVIGANYTFIARLHRLKLLLKNEYRNWNSLNISALNQCRDLITPENIKILDTFKNTRDGNLLERINGVKKAKLYRQSLIGNLGLALGTILKKL